MSSQSIIEVEATYLDQLETDNFKMYKEVQELKQQVAAMTKDLEVMSYQARLFQAQCEIYAGVSNPTYPTVEADENPAWEPDGIEREEGNL